MTDNFDRILDECIDRINRGESAEACLTDYPKYAEQLGPLLRAMLQTHGAYSFVPSASAKREARRSFNAALERLEQRRQAKQPLFSRVFARPVVWATVAAAIIILLVGYFGFRPMLYPTGPVPDPEGNFVFLISDDVNAIGDFESLNVSISKIGLQPGGDSGQWVEFEPEVREVDLTLVPGDKTQEIWRGNVPEGQYSKVFIHVADVHGVLKETGQTVEVKLPSQKLHISKLFQVTTDAVTSFTYDLTVVAAGSPQSGIKYILKPQAGQSGADHKPSKGKGKGRKP
ncbi:hypothetical protein ES702_00294 [subsurface metagenome]